MRVHALDGLRAIAVLCVIAEHTYPDPLVALGLRDGLGGVGVRLFFVLSGFLISGILLRARDEAERCGQSRRDVWIAFYLRRALRIFPLAYLAIMIAWFAGVEGVREHPLSYLLYMENWTMAREGTFHGYMGHFWTLAIEEQFYLVWPLLMLWAPRAWLLPLMSAVVIGSFEYRLWFDYSFWANLTTFGRVDALAWGAVLSMVRIPWWVSIAGVIGLPWRVTFETGAVLLSGGAVQYAAAAEPRWLSWRWLAYLGTISYGLYVVHVPLLGLLPWAERTFDIWLRLPPPTLARFVYFVAASVIVASLSWFLYEKPINQLKDRIPYVRSDRQPKNQLRLYARSGPLSSSPPGKSRCLVWARSQDGRADRQR